MAISPNRSGERCNVFGQQKVEEKSGKIVPIVGVKDVTFSDSKKWRKKGGNQSQSFGVEKAYKSVPIVGVKKAYKSVPIVRQGERCNVSDSKITTFKL